MAIEQLGLQRQASLLWLLPHPVGTYRRDPALSDMPCMSRECSTSAQRSALHTPKFGATWGRCPAFREQAAKHTLRS